MALKFRYPRQIDKPATLLDRLGMAVLSAVIAFLTGLAIWALIAIGPYGSGFALPFGLVVWFTAVMAGLGFLTAESSSSIISRALRTSSGRGGAFLKNRSVRRTAPSCMLNRFNIVFPFREPGTGNEISVLPPPMSNTT